MPDNETQPEWLIGPAVPDLPSVIAAAIMGLPWTHGGTEEEHCWRYGELQEVISAAIAEHAALVAPPDPGSVEALAQRIESIAEQWKGVNGGVYTIRAMSLEIARALAGPPVPSTEPRPTVTVIRSAGMEGAKAAASARASSWGPTDPSSEGATPHADRLVDYWRGRALELEAEANSLRGATVPGAVPPGVYYSAEHDNFYDGTGLGMGELFRQRWQGRWGDFPKHATELAGPPDPGLAERERCARIAEALSCPHIANVIRGTS